MFEKSIMFDKSIINQNYLKEVTNHTQTLRQLIRFFLIKIVLQ